MLKTVFVFAALLLAGSAVRAVTVQEFMSDKKFAPFLKKALATDTCLEDPAIGNEFELDRCPSLLAMLDAVNAGKTDFPGLTCEPECEKSFYSLQPTCLEQLTEQFNLDTAPIGVLGSQFLADCARIHAGGASGAAFAPAPAPVEDMAADMESP